MRTAPVRLGRGRQHARRLLGASTTAERLAVARQAIAGSVAAETMLSQALLVESLVDHLAGIRGVEPAVVFAELVAQLTAIKDGD